jgi:DNA-binding XRE family transcriptional regulator
MDYFDILPVHPQPQPLESLCSYVTRLVEANRLRWPGRFYRLIFPDYRYPRSNSFVDLPPCSLGVMPTITACPEPRLWATTFYYLGRRLINRTEPTKLGAFLKGSTVPYQRYCPACLNEHGYYHLAWRFDVLPGCAQHQCYLLDRCGQCGEPIPLISVPARLGVCPACQTQLATCIATPLSNVDHDLTLVRFHELVALLSPLADQEISLGDQLAMHRERQGLSTAQIARWLGFHRHAAVLAMENKNNHYHPGFLHYLNYAALLSLTLRDLFVSPPNVPDWTERVRRVAQRQCDWLEEQAQRREADMLKRATRATQELFAAGEKVTNKALARQLDTSAGTLRCYPAVGALVAPYRQQRDQQRRERRDAELMALIREKVELALEIPQPLSLMEISRLIGVSTFTIRHYPGTHCYAQRLVDESLRPRRLADEQLMQHMQATADRLQAEGKPVNRETFREAGIVAFQLRFRFTKQSRALFYALIQEPPPPWA